MDYDHHRMLTTTRNRNYAAEQKATGISERDLVIQDLTELQTRFGNKYDDHIKEYISKFGNTFNISNKDLGL